MVATVLGSIDEGCMVIVMVTMVVEILVIVMGILVEVMVVFIDFGSDGRVATCTTATRRCITTVV